MKKYEFIPRVLEAIGPIKNETEMMTYIIMRKRKYLRLIYTTSYLGDISDIKKTKYHLLYTLERFRRNHRSYGDPLIDLLLKYETSYDEIEKLIEEEYKIAVSDFEGLRRSL